jgi:WD40 repeat protein
MNSQRAIERTDKRDSAFANRISPGNTYRVGRSMPCCKLQLVTVRSISFQDAMPVYSKRERFRFMCPPCPGKFARLVIYCAAIGFCELGIRQGVLTSAQENKSDSRRDLPVNASQFTAKAGLDIDGDPLPPGAIARLGTKRFRNPSPYVGPNATWRTVFLPDSRTFLHVTGDGWLQYWDSTSGQITKQFRFWQKRVNGAVASADAKWVVVARSEYDETRRISTNFFTLVDASSGESKNNWSVTESELDQLTISPDGNKVAWSNNDGILHVVKATNGKEIAIHQFGDHNLSCLTFLPDGKTLAVATEHLALWDSEGNGEPLELLLNHSPIGGVNAIAISTDGSLMAWSIREFAATITVHVSDVATGNVVQSLRMPGANSVMRSFTFSPDNAKLAVNSADGAAIWDIASGKMLNELKSSNGSAINLAFSPDGHWLIGWIDFSRAVCVWNLATGELVGADRPGHFQSPNSLRFFDGDRQLASAGDDGGIRVWNLSESRQVRMIHHELNKYGQVACIRAIDVSSDGKYLVSSALIDDTVRLWNLATGQEIFRFPGHGRNGGYRSVRFTPDSKRFASWGDDMRVVVRNVADGKTVLEFRASKNPFDGDNRDAKSQIGSGTLARDASILTTAAAGIRRFAIATGEELPKLSRSGGPGATISTSADNRYLVITRFGEPIVLQLPDGQAKTMPPATFPMQLWDVVADKSAGFAQVSGVNASSTSISPDGRFVAVGVFDENHPRVELLAVPSLASAKQVELPLAVNAVEFSASGKLLATSVNDGTILVWEVNRLLANENQPSKVK